MSTCQVSEGTDACIAEHAGLSCNKLLLELEGTWDLVVLELEVVIRQDGHVGLLPEL